MAGRGGWLLALIDSTTNPTPRTVLSKESYSSHTEIAHSVHPLECMSCSPAAQHIKIKPDAVDLPTPTFPQRTQTATLIIEAAFLCLAIGLLLFSSFRGLHEIVGDLSISFFAIMVEAMPFMLLGSVVGGLIEAFVPEELVSRLLAGRQNKAVFVAAALGMIFPVCECAIVPVVRRLLRKGVPLSAAIAFLLGGPIVNPIVAGSTWLAYRFHWGFLTTRMVCGYTIAVTVALIMNLLFRGKNVLLDDTRDECTTACGCERQDHAPDQTAGMVAKFFAAIQHECDDFFDVGRFLVIGAFIAALARTTIGVSD